MKNGQGKSLGWMKVKSEILRAVINGYDTREKLKKLFTPQVVSSKDIDYHLRGTPEKPGLIRKRILIEKDGKLTLNLQTPEKLREILEDYLLSFPEYRHALDMEFSACFLSEQGDLLTAVHALSEEQTKTLIEYHDWAQGYRPDNNEEIEKRIISLASELSVRVRGHLVDSDKISYVLAYHNLNLLAPSIGEKIYTDAEWREIYDKLSTSEITLAWKDMNLIRESVGETPKELVRLVFDRLKGIQDPDHKDHIFPGANFEDPGVNEAHGIVQMVMHEGIDRLGFNAGLLSWIDSVGTKSPYKREIIKIMCSEGYIPLHELERLGKILKAFNESQRADTKRYMARIEKTIERHHGRLDSLS